MLYAFVETSPTAFHAVSIIAETLTKHGGIHLDAGERWKLEPGHPYFVIRSDASLIAFSPGRKPVGAQHICSPAKGGFILAGAHTDSPGFIARIEKILRGKGMERVPVEIYGGPILSTRLDCPLALAGWVFLRDREASIEQRLFSSTIPVGIVSNLAIHMNKKSSSMHIGSMIFLAAMGCFRLF